MDKFSLNHYYANLYHFMRKSFFTWFFTCFSGVIFQEHLYLYSNVFHNTKFVEAMLFFLLAMLSCLLAPWTLAVLWYLLFPGHAEAVYPQPPVTGPRFSEDDSLLLRMEESLWGDSLVGRGVVPTWDVISFFLETTYLTSLQKGTRKHGLGSSKYLVTLIS